MIFLREVVGQVAEKNPCPYNPVCIGVRKKDGIRQLLYLGDILIFFSVQGRYVIGAAGHQTQTGRDKEAPVEQAFPG